MNFAGHLLTDIQEFKRHLPALGFTSRQCVLEELLFLYHCCLASERLLDDAAAEAKDSVDYFTSSRLSDYYASHLEEERGEVPVLIEDLRHGGIKVMSFFPDEIALSVIGTQYYLIKHVHPISLLGYMAVQEADPTPIGTVEALEKLHGVELFRFVRMHAERDIEHGKELLEVIDEVPEHLQLFVQVSARHTLEFLGRHVYGRR